MVNKLKVIFPLIAIILVIAFSGCTTQKPVKELTPEEVVTQYWTDIGQGNYGNAYDLSYHASQNTSKNIWIDERMAKWGENGSYIKIYSFNVVGSEPVDSSQFEGNFTEARIVNTNATIAYLGRNTTGQLRMVVVNTTDGWKVFGNY
ncbi:MAG TPA: hypothetical protein VMC84_12040 [Methanocella sp.]|uniref:hypothetical protein n=1 Tax=Methanocella sp. TaxID=2052833 RepID=UPI002D0DD61C|nr:hypothetical protein [Methanocella sp.]HTY91897.1 hypothetical protein [Methanocella sp.]